MFSFLEPLESYLYKYNMRALTSKESQELAVASLRDPTHTRVYVMIRLSKLANIAHCYLRKSRLWAITICQSRKHNFSRTSCANAWQIIFQQQRDISHVTFSYIRV